MSSALSPKLVALCGTPEAVEALDDYFKGDAMIELGDFHKHDSCFASREVAISDHVIKCFPFLESYRGGYLYQDGEQSYNCGWDSYEDIQLCVDEQQPSTMELEFNDLMEHLNAYENGMAEEFKAKWFKPLNKRVEVTE